MVGVAAWKRKPRKGFPVPNWLSRGECTLDLLMIQRRSRHPPQHVWSAPLNTARNAASLAASPHRLAP